jgi:hypothetical protein
MSLTKQVALLSLLPVVALGCDSAQGFLISRPLPSGELAALLGARVGGTPDGAAASSRNGRLAVVDAV